MGNHLVFYYHALVSAIIDERNFFDEQRDFQTGDVFLRELPGSFSYSRELIAYHKILEQQGWTMSQFQHAVPMGVAFWETTERRIEKIHETMRPLMHHILSNALEQAGLYVSIDRPVIHFRCADTPFIRHPSYNLQKLCFFTQALQDAERALGTNITRFIDVTLLSSVKHSSQNDLEQPDLDHNACVDYMGYVVLELQEAGYKVEIINNGSVLEDFARLFYAPVVISTSSSFSFFACYFGDGWCATATHGRTQQGVEFCEGCSDRMYLGVNLNHADVVDYHDTRTVLSQLKTSCPERTGHPQYN